MAKGALSFLAGLTSGYLTQKQREEDKERQEKFDQIKLDEAARNKAEWDRADKIRDDIAAAAKKEDTITDDAQVVTGISDRPSVYQNKDLAAADIREVRRMLAQAPAPLAPVSSTALTAGVTAAASNTTDATAAGISTNTNTNVSTGTSAGTSAASNTLAASANQASNGIKPGLLPAAASTAAPASASTPAATTDSTSNSTTAATTVPATATTAIAAAKTASTAPASVTAEIPGTSANGNGSILATQGTGLGRQDAAVPDQANSQAAGQTAGTTADKIADKAVDQPLDKAADIADTAANPAASAASTAASQGISMTPLNKPMFMGKEYADSAAAKKAMDAYNSPAARDARVADAYRRNGDYAGAAKAEAEAVRREAESINLQNLKTQEARKEFGRGMVSSYANGGAGGLMQFLSESPADGAGGAMKFDHTISDDGKTATVYKTDADGNRAKVAEVPNNENGWHTAMFRLQRGLDPTALYEHSLALKKQGLDDARPATEKKNAAVSRTKIADADSPLPVREKNLAATDGVWPQAARTPVMLPSRANVSAGVNNAKSNAVIDYAAQAYGELKNNPHLYSYMPADHSAPVENAKAKNFYASILANPGVGVDSAYSSMAYIKSEAEAKATDPKTGKLNTGRFDQYFNEGISDAIQRYQQQGNLSRQKISEKSPVSGPVIPAGIVATSPPRSDGKMYDFKVDGIPGKTYDTLADAIEAQEKKKKNPDWDGGFEWGIRKLLSRK